MNGHLRKVGIAVLTPRRTPMPVKIVFAGEKG
jgi:hypothetical protein